MYVIQDYERALQYTVICTCACWGLRPVELRKGCLKTNV